VCNHDPEPSVVSDRFHADDHRVRQSTRPWNRSQLLEGQMIQIDIFWPLPLVSLQAIMTLFAAIVLYWLVKFIISIILP
jgi:hypothetical protein